MADIIHKIDWLGLFKDILINRQKGSNLDVLLDTMYGMVFEVSRRGKCF
jgi:hypothetical protein